MFGEVVVEPKKEVQPIFHRGSEAHGDIFCSHVGVPASFLGGNDSTKQMLPSVVNSSIKKNPINVSRVHLWCQSVL